MDAVILAVGKDVKRFISLGCINLVVAANTGGAFSPFGDITTLMVWQKGLVSFTTFFLLFFYGVVLCVGGLGFIGYLAMVSQAMYIDIGPTFANIAVGILSAIVDNIPVMFVVLSMYPDMPLRHWLLVMLTAGVGGSMLSIGSAAGVALMAQARGKYTFFGHLKWSPVILLGYAASILTHIWVNADTFQIAITG
jgi:Na+/H+ antiporter NhaD/arsenite permease-like protein